MAIIENDQQYLDVSGDGTTATVAFHDDTTYEQQQELFQAAKEAGFTEVIGSFYDVESAFTFLEVGR